jgi:hypothetical protein
MIVNRKKLKEKYCVLTKVVLGDAANLSGKDFIVKYIANSKQ